MSNFKAFKNKTSKRYLFLKYNMQSKCPEQLSEDTFQHFRRYLKNFDFFESFSVFYLKDKLYIYIVVREELIKYNFHPNYFKLENETGTSIYPTIGKTSSYTKRQEILRMFSLRDGKKSF